MLEIMVRHHVPGFRLDVDFQAPSGVTALFGKSGAGKTTLVRAVAGLVQARHARVVVNGVTLDDSAQGLRVPPYRRRIGYVFQDGRLFPHMTVRQNLAYGQRAVGRRDLPMQPVVTLLGIAHLLDRRPADLSGGEAQRVALGRALMSAPRLLLMDEPLAALDRARKNEILPYLDRICRETGVPILYVTHSLTEIARLASTVAVIDAGKIMRVGSVAEVLSDPDLAPNLGVQDAGAVLNARVVAHHTDGLSELQVSGGTLWLPRVQADVGRDLRVRVTARDVIVARDRPSRISALNILPAQVRQVRQGTGPGVILQLSTGDDLLLARLTRRSANALELRPGCNVFAVIKSVSVAPADVSVDDEALSASKPDLPE
jgi:molybdate transport system ATP-binding protein